MLKIPIELVNQCYRLEIPKSELNKIPDFAGKEVFLSFSASGASVDWNQP